MNEDLHTGAWIVAKLESATGAGGLFDPAQQNKPSGVYFGIIPPDVTFPAIRFHVHGSNDIRGVGTPAQRIMTRIDWLVAVVTQGRSLVKLVELADKVDTLLHNVSGETSTLRVLSCVRLEPFSLAEEEDTPVGFRHAGGIYRTIVKAK